MHIDTTGERGVVTVTDTATDAAATRSFVVGGAATHRGALLRAVHAALRASGATMRAIVSVDVVPGPGRFSAIRLGIATANALAWALGVPLVVHGKSVRVAVPEYGAEPAITQQSARPLQKSSLRGVRDVAISRHSINRGA